MSTTTTFTPLDPDFAARVRESFGRQTVMATIGAHLAAVEPGRVEIHLPFRADLCQQHGFLHAGIVTTVIDSACGYAAGSLAAPDAGLLSVELKANFLAPARGAWFRAEGRVVKAGRTISVTTGDLWASDVPGGPERHVAMLQATMMTVVGRDGVRG